MKKYDVIFFDLDGTLTDPGLGITNSVMYALEHMGITVTDRSALYPFIGPPLVDSFREFYGFSKEAAEQAVLYYREYFSEKGLFENELYNGIGDLLKDLKDAGKRVVLATSKPEPFAVQILKHFKIDGYFDYIAGSRLDGSRGTKDEVIQYALELCRAEDHSKVIMVGDRKFDILGAKKYGLDSMGVLFGYGSREELSAAGADYLVETIGEIAKILLGINLSEIV